MDIFNMTGPIGWEEVTERQIDWLVRWCCFYTSNSEMLVLPQKTNTLRCCIWWMCVFVLQLYFQMRTGVPQIEDFFPKDRFCFGSRFCFSPVRSEFLRRRLPVIRQNVLVKIDVYGS